MSKLFQTIFSVLMVLLLIGCNEVPVAQDLTQGQAHAVVAALADNGIESSADRAKGSKGLYAVNLSSNEYARAIQILRDLGLPGEVRPTVAQLMSSDGLLPPGREMEMLKIDRAVAGEIEELLASHPAIVSARAVVRSASLSDSSQPPTVSLVVTVRSALAEDQIKSLVRQVAAGVAPENISIAVENARAKTSTKGALTEQKLSSFLFFWRVPQSDVLGLTVAVFALVIGIGLVAAILGFASGTARATANAANSFPGADLSRTALPGGPSVTSSRLRLSELRNNGEGSSSEEPLA